MADRYNRYLSDKCGLESIQLSVDGIYQCIILIRKKLYMGKYTNDRYKLSGFPQRLKPHLFNLMVESLHYILDIASTTITTTILQEQIRQFYQSLFNKCVRNDNDGCDAPKSADGFSKASEGFPTPVTSPLRPPTPPAAQMRQYSGRIYDRKEVCFCIRILKPLKTEKEEDKLKGKELKDFIIKDLHQNREKTMTSLLSSRSKAERGNQ